MTDIRKGDLIRAIHKDRELVVEGRVVSDSRDYLDFDGASLYRPNYDIEVLDRAIDEELLVGAIEAYRQSAELTSPWGEVDVHAQSRHRKHLTAVIKFVNEYNAKEKK